MTPQDKQDAFYKELKELLVKYDAQIQIMDFGCGYIREPKMVVEFDYDESYYWENKTEIFPKLILGLFENGR